MTDDLVNTANYPPPVDQLLSLEPIETFGKEWLDYRQLGLAAEHVPDLIRMSVDEGLYYAPAESPLAWAPVHAWRALGQFGAASAVLPLLKLLDEVEDDDDWVHEELPRVFTMIGPVILPELIQFLDDAERQSWARITIAGALKDIALSEIDRRQEVVAALAQALSNWQENGKSLNASLISYLADLKAVETAPLMEEAFGGQQVDLSVDGDWEDIQIRLGLLSERITPRPDYNPEIRQAVARHSTPGQSGASGERGAEGEESTREDETEGGANGAEGGESGAKTEPSA
jgi:hypothetical protein